MSAPAAVLAYVALIAAALGLLLACSSLGAPKRSEAIAGRGGVGGARPRATLRRALAYLMTWTLTAELVLVTLVSSSVPALADSSDLLLITTPPPPGFTKEWECFLHYEGTHISPFDGDDATFCTVDNGDPHNVTANFHWVPGPSQRFTIRSFRIKVDHTNPRAFLTSLHVKCGMNESGQVGRPTVWQAPSSMMNVFALDTGYVDLEAPCEIVSNTGHGYAGFSMGWTSHFAAEPFCCTGLRIYSLEAYAEPRAATRRVPGFSLGKPLYVAFSPDPVNLATGNFVHEAEDLVLPGRILGFSFTRWYNSADGSSGPLGPGWTHSYNWSLADRTSEVELRRGDGSRHTFTRNPDGSYATPPDIFDTLRRNADGSFTLTLTSQVAYEFSSTGRLARIHEPAGNALGFVYLAGDLVAIIDTVGRLVTLGYDTAHRLIQLLDPLGRRITYAYDAAGRLSTVTDQLGNAPGEIPAAHQWRYAYDGSTSHLTTITDPDGRVRVTNLYDTQGRVVEQRDGLGALTTFAYETGQTTLTNPRGHQTTYTFDSRMRVLSQADVVGGATLTLSYTYDAAGKRTSVTDRNGGRTDFSYDGRGNVLSKIDPAPQSGAPRPETRFSHDERNNLIETINARGSRTTLTYDATTNALLSISRQIDTTTFALTKYEYSDPTNPGLPTRVISPRGNTAPSPDYTFSMTLRYDAQGNLVERTDPDAARTTFTYDAAGRLLSSVDPDGNSPGGIPAEHTWQIAYDELDREVRRTDPLGNTLRYAYDGAGNRRSVTDRNGNTTTYSYDANARLATGQQKPDPVGNPTLIYASQVSRDANGNATRIVQANGVATDYAYDALNRLVAVTTHPDAQTDLTTGYVLDGNGNPTSRSTADGITLSYAYDGLSRLTAVSAPGVAIAYAYDELGLRTQMSDGTGITTYTYDGLGRLTQVAAPNGTLGYAYDRDSNRASLSYPGGDTVTYAYSPGGRLSSVRDWASRLSTYTYRASGLVSSLLFPNALRAAYTYDNAQRLTSLRYTLGTTVASDAYGLDPEGNRIRIDATVQGMPAATNTLRYDGLNRLMSTDRRVVPTGADFGSESFSYDSATNLATRTNPAATYSHDRANRVTSDGTRSFAWSPADRLVQRGSDTFTYDALGRLTGSTISGVTRTYAYDGDALLRSRTTGAQTTGFLYDTSLAPARLLRAGSERIVHGLGPLYRVHANGAYDVLATDGLGSVRAEVSGSGSLTNAYDYASYGALRLSRAGPPLLGFAGELRDPGGLVYLRARWYDPAAGRFMTSNPVPGDAAKPSTMNAFAYVLGNPITLTDPTGHCVPWCSGAAIGAIAYLAGLTIVNVIVKQKPLEQSLDSFTWGDLAISTAAGLVTGGASSFGWSTAQQIGFAAVVGFDATGASMLANGRSDPLELVVGTVAGGAGGFVPGGESITGFVRGVAAGGVLSAAQTWLTEDGIPYLQQLFRERRAPRADLVPVQAVKPR